MKRFKKILIWFVVIGFMVGGLVWGFLATGGIGLVRLYKNYLLQNLTEKKYSAQDFIDRGPREMLYGYYAGGDDEGVYIWTLSGLKRFVHRDMTSVYYYVDPCAMVQKMATGQVDGTTESLPNGGYKVREELYFSLQEWRERVETGDYVWVKRVGEGAERKVIDKIFGSSNKYFPLVRLTLKQCE